MLDVPTIETLRVGRPQLVITHCRLIQEEGMNAPTADAITSIELRELLESSTAPRVVDVRTPAEFETVHIAGVLQRPARCAA